MNKYLLAGATVLLSTMGSFLGTLGYDWIKDVNADRKEMAKIVIQLEERAKYYHGDTPAAPVATPSERLKESAAAAPK